MVFVLSLLVAQLSFVCCLIKAELRDLGITWVASFIFLCVHCFQGSFPLESILLPFPY